MTRCSVPTATAAAAAAVALLKKAASFGMPTLGSPHSLTLSTYVTNAADLHYAIVRSGHAPLDASAIKNAGEQCVALEASLSPLSKLQSDQIDMAPAHPSRGAGRRFLNVPSSRDTNDQTLRISDSAIIAASTVVATKAQKNERHVDGLDANTSYDVYFVAEVPGSNGVFGTVQAVLQSTAHPEPPVITFTSIQSADESATSVHVQVTLSTSGRVYFALVPSAQQQSTQWTPHNLVHNQSVSEGPLPSAFALHEQLAGSDSLAFEKVIGGLVSATLCDLVVVTEAVGDGKVYSDVVRLGNAVRTHFLPLVVTQLAVAPQDARVDALALEFHVRVYEQDLARVSVDTLPFFTFSMRYEATRLLPNGEERVASPSSARRSSDTQDSPQKSAPATSPQQQRATAAVTNAQGDSSQEQYDDVVRGVFSFGNFSSMGEFQEQTAMPQRRMITGLHNGTLYAVTLFAETATSNGLVGSRTSSAPRQTHETAPHILAARGTTVNGSVHALAMDTEMERGANVHYLVVERSALPHTHRQYLQEAKSIDHFMELIRSGGRGDAEVIAGVVSYDPSSPSSSESQHGQHNETYTTSFHIDGLRGATANAFQVVMSPSSSSTMDKLNEDNYFHWEFNMRMKLARKGLLPHIIRADMDSVSDRTTNKWKEDDLKALGVIAGEVSITYQVYIRAALTADQAWKLLEEQFNRNTLKNRILITKRMHSFKMESGTRFAEHVDRFKELVTKLETIGEVLDESRQIVLLLGSLPDEYRMISSVLENTPNLGLMQVIESLYGADPSGYDRAPTENAFVINKRRHDCRDRHDNSNGPKRFNGKCNFCKKVGHKEADCRKKKFEDQQGRRAAERTEHRYAFAAAMGLDKSVWLVDSGASSHMTSRREKFVKLTTLKTPIQIVIADGTKIDAVGIGEACLKMEDDIEITLSNVLYIPALDGNLLSVSKLAEKGVRAEFVRDKCVFKFGQETVMTGKRDGSVYKVHTVLKEECRAANGSANSPWMVMHAKLGHIPYKRYQHLRTMADGLPAITNDDAVEEICEGCCMGKMAADNFPRHPANKVKTQRVLELVHTDVMGPMQTKTPGGCLYAIVFVDDYSRHVSVYFMKKKSEALDKFKIFKSELENLTDCKIKRLRSDNGGEYTSKRFVDYLVGFGIKHEKTVPYTPQQNGMAERMNRTLVEMARCMLYHESVDKKWWAEAVNTAAWIINRIPNSVNTKTPHELIYGRRPNMKNLKVFGALGYAHIPKEKRKKLDAKAFKCRFLGYSETSKGYRVFHVATGLVHIVRTVKFMETSRPDLQQLSIESDSDDESETEDQEVHDRSLVLPEVKSEIVTQDYVFEEPSNMIVEAPARMLTRSRARALMNEPEPEDRQPPRKKLIRTPVYSGPKRQKTDQVHASGGDDEHDRYALVNPDEHALLASEAPKHFREATSREDHAKWKEAMESELKSLVANGTWDLVPRPKSQKPIGSRWVFALKKNERGEVVRYKARVVAKGYSQCHGIDYEETYAPVAALTSVRAFLATSCSEQMEVQQWDVDTAFLYGDLEETIFMEVPEGSLEFLLKFGTKDIGNTADIDDNQLVCRLRKSLYGLKQASRVWNETIDSCLCEIGFEPTDADPCVYTKRQGNSKCLLCLYVDDMLIASNDQAMIAGVKQAISKRFKIKDLGQARFILGIEVHHDISAKTLSISQKSYIDSVIERFGQTNAAPSLTPIDPSTHLSKGDEAQSEADRAEMKTKPYRSLIGSLMYLACGTRPDIAVAVARLSRFLENPGPKHWDAGIKVVKYLKKTKDVGIVYDGSLESKLSAFCDADWACDRNDRRSMSGILLMLCGGPIAWRATFQKTVALSTTEAEYMALCDCVKECVWMRTLLKNIGLEQYEATPIFEDNQGAIALAKNIEYQARTKHIDIRYHFIREKLKENEIVLEYVESKNQIADYLTKGLSSKTLRYLMENNGVFGRPFEQWVEVQTNENASDVHCVAAEPVLGSVSAIELVVEMTKPQDVLRYCLRATESTSAVDPMEEPGANNDLESWSKEDCHEANRSTFTPLNYRSTHSPSSRGFAFAIGNLTEDTMYRVHLFAENANCNQVFSATTWPPQFVKTHKRAPAIVNIDAIPVAASTDRIATSIVAKESCLVHYAIHEAPREDSPAVVPASRKGESAADAEQALVVSPEAIVKEKWLALPSTHARIPFVSQGSVVAVSDLSSKGNAHAAFKAANLKANTTYVVHVVTETAATSSDGSASNTSGVYGIVTSINATTFAVAPKIVKATVDPTPNRTDAVFIVANLSTPGIVHYLLSDVDFADPAIIRRHGTDDAVIDVPQPHTIRGTFEVTSFDIAMERLNGSDESTPMEPLMFSSNVTAEGLQSGATYHVSLTTETFASGGVFGDFPPPILVTTHLPAPRILDLVLAVKPKPGTSGTLALELELSRFGNVHYAVFFRGLVPDRSDAIFVERRRRADEENASNQDNDTPSDDNESSNGTKTSTPVHLRPPIASSYDIAHLNASSLKVAAFEDTSEIKKLPLNALFDVCLVSETTDSDGVFDWTSAEDACHRVKTHADYSNQSIWLDEISVAPMDGHTGSIRIVLAISKLLDTPAITDDSLSSATRFALAAGRMPYYILADGREARREFSSNSFSTSGKNRHRSGFKDAVSGTHGVVSAGVLSNITHENTTFLIVTQEIHGLKPNHQYFLFFAQPASQPRIVGGIIGLKLEETILEKCREDEGEEAIEVVTHDAAPSLTKHAAKPTFGNTSWITVTSDIACASCSDVIVHALKVQSDADDERFSRVQQSSTVLPTIGGGSHGAATMRKYSGKPLLQRRFVVKMENVRDGKLRDVERELFATPEEDDQTMLIPNTTYTVLLATETAGSNGVLSDAFTEMQVTAFALAPTFEYIQVTPRNGSTTELVLVFELSRPGEVHYLCGVSGNPELNVTSAAKGMAIAASPKDAKNPEDGRHKTETRRPGSSSPEQSGPAGATFTPEGPIVDVFSADFAIDGLNEGTVYDLYFRCETLSSFGVFGAWTQFPISARTHGLPAEVPKEVECAVHPSCEELGRETCTRTANVCGECLDGFTGQPGSSNEPCVRSVVVTDDYLHQQPQEKKEITQIKISGVCINPFAGMSDMNDVTSHDQDLATEQHEVKKQQDPFHGLEPDAASDLYEDQMQHEDKRSVNQTEVEDSSSRSSEDTQAARGLRQLEEEDMLASQEGEEGGEETQGIMDETAEFEQGSLESSLLEPDLSAIEESLLQLEVVMGCPTHAHMVMPSGECECLPGYTVDALGEYCVLIANGDDNEMSTVETTSPLERMASSSHHTESMSS
ncbi:Integrase catalytic core protein, partial [Globisporangium splendens]